MIGLQAAAASAGAASAPPFFSAMAASTRAMRETGDYIRPSSWASSTSLLGIAASAFTPFASSALPA